MPCISMGEKSYIRENLLWTTLVKRQLFLFALSVGSCYSSYTARPPGNAGIIDSSPGFLALLLPVFNLSPPPWPKKAENSWSQNQVCSVQKKWPVQIYLTIRCQFEEEFTWENRFNCMIFLKSFKGNFLIGFGSCGRFGHRNCFDWSLKGVILDARLNYLILPFLFLLALVRNQTFKYDVIFLVHNWFFFVKVCWGKCHGSFSVGLPLIGGNLNHSFTVLIESSPPLFHGRVPKVLKVSWWREKKNGNEGIKYRCVFCKTVYLNEAEAICVLHSV
jgi:hypothetical protein